MGIDNREYEYMEHPFKPVFDESSRILILGSFPSPKSRENGFYFSHPKNKFWAVLAEIFGVPEPERNTQSRTEFLLSNHIAVWDVLHSCKIAGAADSSIREPQANKFNEILRQSEIHAVFTTGRTATELFNELASTEAGIRAIYLPSTSPANVSWRSQNSFDIWKSEILKAL